MGLSAVVISLVISGRLCASCIIDCILFFLSFTFHFFWGGCLIGDVVR